MAAIVQCVCVLMRNTKCGVCVTRTFLRAVKTARLLLQEYLGLVSSTHIRRLTTACNSSSGSTSVLFGPFVSTCTYSEQKQNRTERTESLHKSWVRIFLVLWDLRSLETTDYPRKAILYNFPLEILQLL